MYFKVSSSTYAILAVSTCLSIQGIICISSLFEGHPGHANVKETLYNFTQFFNAEKIGETQLLLEDMTEYSNVITGKRNISLKLIQLQCHKTLVLPNHLNVYFE